ncbi:MAG: hypothetical protein ACFCVC_09170 [Acidimicrobiia bacterium]
MDRQLPTDPVEMERLLLDTLDELDRLKLTLEVVGTTDLDAGILNRTGILESLERGRKWMARRGDIYGLLVVRFPTIRSLDAADPNDLEIIQHLAATIGAGVREVDEVGRIDDMTFASTLADLKPGTIQVVADRVADLLAKTLRSLPDLGQFKVGAVEVINAGHTSGTVLDSCIRIAEQATIDSHNVAQI